MISPARKLAYRLLWDIESRRVFSDDALNSEAMEKLEVRDRNLTTEIVYGALRWQGVLDYVLSRVSSRPWAKVDSQAKILLRISLYQMQCMDRIPDHALVNDAVEIAKRDLGRSVSIYVNGILRQLARTRPWNKEGFLRDAPNWMAVSLPEWIWNRWSSRFGEDAALEFALSLNQPPRAAFRMSDEFIESLPFEAVASDIVPGAVIRRTGQIEEGCNLRRQDEASQLIPHLLGAKEGWHVWDACAAPGGKTAVLAAICGESGRVVASDWRHERLSRLASLVSQAGSARPDILVADASSPAPFRRRFDAVLADVPCSGLGTLRRNPEIKWHTNPEDLASLQEIQRKILDSVSDCVRPGGRLLYSTCSTEPEENEQIVEGFLRTHPDFFVQEPDTPPGIEKWTGKDRMVRTFPGTRLWDGFFAALMFRRT